MAKDNNVFAKGAVPAKTDPVKQAQEEATVVEKEATAIEDLLQDTQVVVKQEPEVIKQPGEAVVKDTTVAQSKELTTSTIIKPQVQQKSPTVVSRPTGASTREASPQSTGGQATKVTSVEFAAMVAKERREGTASASHFIIFMEQYVKVMAPKKITSMNDVIKSQEGLYDQLMNIITRAPAKEFSRLWNIAIAYVREYKDGCFNPMYYSRGAREWKRDPGQFTTLTSLLNLLQATATDMASVNQVVSINAVVGKGFSEDARGRVINFYMK